MQRSIEKRKGLIKNKETCWLSWEEFNAPPDWAADGELSMKRIIEKLIELIDVTARQNRQNGAPSEQKLYT